LLFFKQRVCVSVSLDDFLRGIPIGADLDFDPTTPETIAGIKAARPEDNQGISKWWHGGVAPAGLGRETQLPH
jgi:hypothetical protein